MEAHLKPDYDESYYRSRELWPDFRYEIKTILRQAALSGDSRVLELGCGGGELLARLEQQTRLAVGTDLSSEGLRLARLEGRGHLLCGRAEQLPFSGNSFDALVAQHLVEHLSDPAEALREWRRVLRPGGILALVTPNALHPDPELFYDPTHVSLFTPATLRSALEDTGFEVTHLSTLFPFLGRGRLARSISIRLGTLGQYIPAFAQTGRSLVVAARVRYKPPRHKDSKVHQESS